MKTFLGVFRHSLLLDESQLFWFCKKMFTLVRHYVTRSCKNVWIPWQNPHNHDDDGGTGTAKNQKQNSNFARWNSLLKMENAELTLVLWRDILANDKCLHTGKISLRASFPFLLNRRGLAWVTLLLCSIQLLLRFIRGTFLDSALVNPSTLLKQDAIWAYIWASQRAQTKLYACEFLTFTAFSLNLSMFRQNDY